MRNFWRLSADLVLGTEPKQRIRTGNSLLWLFVYLLFAVVQHVEVRIGLIDAASSWPLTVWNLTGATGFFLAVRSGLNLKLARKGDPAWTIPQMLWATMAICWSYAITGPARGAVILILLPALIYCVLALTERQSRKLTATAFLMLGSVMLFKAATDPTRYDPRVEGMHMLFAAIVMGTVWAVSIRIGQFRERLQQQRAELSKALERIQLLATRDELTGLTNRRAASQRMREELDMRPRRSQLEQPAFALVLMDIDHFKRVNDTFGHAAGDEVLRRFASVAESQVRVGELLSRWGGEEFLLVLPGSSGHAAIKVAERLRERLAREDFGDLAPDLNITFSAGVACCCEGDGLDDTVARADRALYEAKDSGRDRICLDHREVQAAPHLLV
jgi:diguanylate cyclase (GGDEF)-like protein